MKKRSFADALQGGLMGGVGGAKTGAAFGPEGSLIGGGLGALLGAGAGFLEGDANSAYDELNMQEQGLNNDLLQQQLVASKRKNREDGATERGLGMFRGFLGSAFKTNNPSFAAGLKAYPGLGNQGVP